MSQHNSIDPMSADNSGRGECKLTVVIIGRNEEQFIGAAISSALAAKIHLPAMEVIFVDSASTDRSIEVASRYPIRILQLRREWPLCVAAGRYTGYLHSRGEYIFFQDGDSLVEADWLFRAVRFMDQHREYGAVAGVLDEQYLDVSGEHLRRVTNATGQNLSRPINECKVLGGLALFRRQAMEKAGPINPHLPTAEDHELCMRIRNAGFKLARIEGLMALKFTENRQTIREVLRRSRTRMYDYGAVIRYAAQYGGAWQFCVEIIPYLLTYSVVAGLYVLAIPLAIYFEVLWILFFSALFLTFILIVKKRGIHGAGLSIAVRTASTFRTILSFFRTRPRPIQSYPTDVIQVQ
jgi:glycosyltransferase involved in cell wall biosynthesis